MLDWDIIKMAIPLLAEGLTVTLYVSFFAGIIGTLAGIILGLLSLSNIKPLELFIRVYVDFCARHTASDPDFLGVLRFACNWH